MRGLILINAYPNGEKFYKQANRIAEELQKLGVQTDVLKNGELEIAIQDNGTVRCDAAKNYDFAVYLDKDKYLGELLEKMGLRLFNRAAAVAVCDDKVSTYAALVGKNIQLIKTIPAPLCYTPNAKTDEKFLTTVAQKLGFPLVVKSSYGSFGVGVTLVHGISELIETSQKLLHQPHCFQQYVAESAGRDIRVIVIGGKAVAAMKRIAQKGEFRSNVELGGVGQKISLKQKYLAVAERVATVLGLDYCGIDLLETRNGPIVCEVNSNAFFEGLEKTTGYNVAAAYAKYIVETIQNKSKIKMS